MARAATETQKAGLTGLEFGLAIPGTVGGAVWANAGAHDAETAGVLESATVLFGDGTERELPADELGFALPAQPVQGRAAGARRRPAEIVMAPTSGSRPPTRPRSSAGSTRSATGARHTSRWGSRRRARVFRNPDGDSAGRLIDELGLKGTRIGGSVVSEKHANFIVNDQRGTAADVRRLAELVRRTVRERHGIELRARDRVHRGLVRLERGGRLMPVPPFGHEPAATPVAVVFGGPSAEHDVSVVSGHRDRRGPDGRRLPGVGMGSSTSTAAGGGCPTATGAMGGRRPPTTTRPRSGPRSEPAGRGARVARGGGAPAGRVPRAPRPVRRGRHGPGAVRGGRPRVHGLGRDGERRSAWTRRCSSDSSAGWGCRSSTGARSARRAGPATPTAC